MHHKSRTQMDSYWNESPFIVTVNSCKHNLKRCFDTYCHLRKVETYFPIWFLLNRYLDPVRRFLYSLNIFLCYLLDLYIRNIPGRGLKTFINEESYSVNLCLLNILNDRQHVTKRTQYNFVDCITRQRTTTTMKEKNKISFNNATLVKRWIGSHNNLYCWQQWRR